MGSDAPPRPPLRPDFVLPSYPRNCSFCFAFVVFFLAVSIASFVATSSSLLMHHFLQLLEYFLYLLRHHFLCFLETSLCLLKALFFVLDGVLLLSFEAPPLGASFRIFSEATFAVLSAFFAASLGSGASQAGDLPLWSTGSSEAALVHVDDLLTGWTVFFEGDLTF